MVAAQPVAGCRGTGGGGGGRCLVGADDPHRRDSGPLGRAGHPVHRVLRAGAAGGRGPGDLPDHLDDALGALRQGGPRLLLLRLLLRLRHLRGRHGSLLGAFPGARVRGGPRGQAAAGRLAAARTGRDWRGLGLHVRAELGFAVPGGAALAPGLVPEVRPADRRGRLGGCLDRRLRAPVPGRGGPGPAARLRPFAARRPTGDRAVERRRGRPADRDGGAGVHGPRARLRQGVAGPGDDRPRLGSGRRAGPAWTNSPAACRTTWRSRSRTTAAA